MSGVGVGQSSGIEIEDEEQHGYEHLSRYDGAENRVHLRQRVRCRLVIVRY